jgi:hypothetical protein
MDNKPKKNVKKPKKRAPRKRAPRKDKSVKQNVNVNVTSSGGGGSGGMAAPAPSSYNPILQSAMQQREENVNLIRQLENLKNKQEMGNQLLRDIQKKPNDMNIKQDIKEVLKDEKEIQTDIINEIGAQENEPILEENRSSSSSMETPNKSLTPYEKSEEGLAEMQSLRQEIKRLKGKVGSRASLPLLRSVLNSLRMDAAYEKAANEAVEAYNEE